MKLKTLFIIILIALALTLATTLFYRYGPIEGVYGNMCGDPGLCYGPVANSGLPFPYMIDDPAVSYVSPPFIEDFFRPTAFLMDFLFFTLVISLLSPKMWEWVKTLFPSSGATRQIILRLAGAALIMGFILALFSIAYQQYNNAIQEIKMGEFGYRFRCERETCFEPALSGGFPFPYVEEDITQYPKKHLDPLVEDRFNPWAFLLDVGVYALVCGAGGYFFWRRGKQLTADRRQPTAV